MSGIGRTLPFDRPAIVIAPAPWLRRGCVGAVFALVTVGTLLFARRLAGAFSINLPPVQLLTSGAFAGIIVFGSRFLWRSVDELNGHRRLEAVIGWGGTVALVLLALGCSLGGRLPDWAFWLSLLAIDQWQLRWFLRSRVRGVITISTEPEPPPLYVEIGGHADAMMLGRVICLTAETELQRVVRLRDEEGAESIHATLRAEFVSGQRQATLHVAFCPPLEQLPAIEMEAVDGPEAELKLAQTYSHGARLEVRLSEPAEEDCTVMVEMIARPPSEAD